LPLQHQFPSPPEGYKSDLAVMPAPFQQWPSCLPGYRFAQSPTSQPAVATPPAAVVAAPGPPSSSAGTTQSTIPELDESEACSPRLEEAAAAGSAAPPGGGEEENADSAKLKQLNGPLADSPDEGYVGDGQETSDI